MWNSHHEQGGHRACRTSPLAVPGSLLLETAIVSASKAIHFLCPLSLGKTCLGRQPLICAGEAVCVFPLRVQENVLPWDGALKPLRALPPHQLACLPLPYQAIL